MTISKSQGQMLNRVGIYLMTHGFTYGMLYVAASRVNNLKLFILDIDGSKNKETQQLETQQKKKAFLEDKEARLYFYAVS
jgi:ATP-dependent exoDNAse (exonuclease V) alpha subunit